MISPSNKHYVGQTRRTVKIRVDEHIKQAKYAFDTGCLCLNKAIRKYGGENFTVETVLECDADDLDIWEETFISIYDCMAPNGYNLTSGGNSQKNLSEETIKRKSQSRRRYYKEEGLPVYVQRLETEYGEGYIVDKSKFPKGQFCSPKLSMDEKRKLAIEYLSRIDKGLVPEKSKRNIPTHVYEFNCPDKSGYCIKLPGKPEIWIRDSKLTMDEKRTKILEKLEAIENGTFNWEEDRGRKYDKDVHMEPYVSRRNTPLGYEYRRGKESASFCAKRLTMDEKRNKANAYAVIANLKHDNKNKTIV